MYLIILLDSLLYSAFISIFFKISFLLFFYYFFFRLRSPHSALLVFETAKQNA